MNNQRPTSLVIRNLFRRPFRNSVLLVCVAATVGMQVAAALLDQVSQEGLKVGLSRLGADLVVVPRGFEEAMYDALLTGEAGRFYMPGEVEREIAKLDFVQETSSQIYVKSLAKATCCSFWNVFIIGFDPKTDFNVRPWLLRNRDRPLGKDDILVGAAINAEVGGKLKFFGHEFTVAGILLPSGMGLDTTVFIPLPTVYLMARESGIKAEKTLDIQPTDISAVLIKLKPKERGGPFAADAAYELEKAFPKIIAIMPDDIVTKVQKNMVNTLSTLRSASYAIWPVAALLIGLVFAMATNERQREIGLLRAMGATKGFVFKMIIFEALIITGFAAVLGLLVSFGLVAGFSDLIATTLKIPFYWIGLPELMVLFFWALILALATGVAAALYPAFRISRLEPYEAMRRSE